VAIELTDKERMQEWLPLRTLAFKTMKHHGHEDAADWLLGEQCVISVAELMANEENMLDICLKAANYALVARLAQVIWDGMAEINVAQGSTAASLYRELSKYVLETKLKVKGDDKDVSMLPL